MTVSNTQHEKNTKTRKSRKYAKCSSPICTVCGKSNVVHYLIVAVEIALLILAMFCFSSNRVLARSPELKMPPPLPMVPPLPGNMTNDEEEGDKVVYSYDTPSNEMDFNVAPVPSLADEKRDEEDSKEDKGLLDRFFSSAPIIDDDVIFEDDDIFDNDTQPAEEKKAEEEKKEPPKKKRRRYVAKPPFKFKSQIYPDTIYKKHYRDENRHLPVALYKQDMNAAMSAAISRGDIDTVRALERMGVSLNIRDINGDPLIVTAVKYNQPNSVRWLAAVGAPLNQINVDGLTALHLAANAGNKKLTHMLLEAGADPNIVDNKGRSPLYFAGYAPSNKRPEIMNLLRSYGAKS